MTAVITKAGSYIFMIILGYVFKKKHILEKSAQDVLMGLIMKVTLPAAVIASFLNFERELSLFLVAVLGLVMNFIMIGIGLFLSAKKSREEKAFFVINYSGYNIGTFTMPYLQSFIGAMGVITACLFDAGNALMCTGFTYAIASRISSSKKTGIKEFMGKVVSSVPFDTYVVMMILYFLNIHLPEQVYVAAGNLGQANAFLAMVMLGMAFEFPRNKKVIREVAVMLFIRYFVAALASCIVWMFLPCSEQVRQIVILLLFAPMSALNVINTIKCKGNSEKAGAVNSLSILFSLLIITFLVAVFFRA